MGRPDQYFRAGVGAIVANRTGLVLALERANVPGAWQAPQGGLEGTEEPEAALFRELEEETGISRPAAQVVDRYPEPLAYVLPPEARRRKTGLGQVHFWFLVRFIGDDGDIDVSPGGEFRAWQWLPFAALVDQTVGFRRQVYRRLMERFGSVP